MADAVEQHLLIVETDILIRQPLAEYLRDCGYKVVEAADIVEARKLLSEGKFRIDVVLADVDADSDNAFALAKWIRTEHPGIEVMLAGTIETATRKAGDLCEEGSRVTKPYEHHLVLSRIKQSLAVRESSNKPSADTSE
jgi:DNA-binding response OmpR family regulator